ncbi:peptidylprolyl isomerase [Sulfurospirillum sp. 1612]|uniref:peptidylprolyl isomerase n=1 Tax=Sulfurospirillum sp. 1612 TaxID=3094835 RepID=UPI002F9498F0
MITWMQHRKKYLVITIWIATIAFIGAGFVGWGAYDMNTNRAKSVAKVGNRNISVEEFQQAYANNFNYYNQQLGGKLTQEEADKMGLDKVVMQNIINEALLLNFANDMGFIVLKKDIENALIQDKNFQTDGVFDKNKYYSLLKAQRMTPKEYENSLKKELLLNKLQAVLNLPISKQEIEVFGSSIFMQDKLNVSVLSINPRDIVIKTEALKKFWEQHKQAYMTKKKYILDTIKVALDPAAPDTEALKKFWESKKYLYKDKEGKLLSFEDANAKVTIDFKLKASKQKALETYLKLKKGEITPTGTKTVYDDDTAFPLKTLRVLNQGQVMKPIAMSDGYLIAKLKQVLMPREMTFEEANAQVTKDYRQTLLKSELEKKATARLDLFNGQNTGFVSRDSQVSINGLNSTQSSQFINFIFDQAQTKGYKVFGNKVAMYRVLEQKLLNQEKLKLYKNIITNSITQNKKAELYKNLLATLRTMYKTEQYYKGK